MAAPVMGERHRRYLFSHQSRPLNRYSHRAGPRQHCSPSTPSTKRYSSRPYAICYPPSLYQASHWALRCPKPGMAAPFGECHLEVSSLLSHLLEGDRGPLSRLETSSSSGGTNDSTIVCLNIPHSNKHHTHAPTSPARSIGSCAGRDLATTMIYLLYASELLASMLSASLSAPISSPWTLRCPKPGMAAPVGECHWESFPDSLGCFVRPKDRGMAAPSIGECHRRYSSVPLRQSLFALGGTSPTLNIMIYLLYAASCLSPMPCVSSLCVVSLHSNHFSLDPSVSKAQRASVEVDRGPLSHLVSSSSPVGTNDPKLCASKYLDCRTLSLSQAIKGVSDPGLPPGYCGHS
ncbi:hypothetical protein CVT26_008618 [Gymnopilus dilepis]|uniref:Uncharacterized protein n=1 Tax=Gymnopilus dilepis TaxID=231916 RepID=A0A409XXV2_9AGAR|nr:hypothetical protein CVT26_008618 [Gymnopilus dilepis]